MAVDWKNQKLEEGDVVLVDFRGFSNETSGSLHRSIGIVVDSEELEVSLDEIFVKTKNPKSNNINYLCVDTWSKNIEKVSREFNEDVLELYF